jgi:TonB family protein
VTLLVDLAVGATILFTIAWAAVITLGSAAADLRRAVWRAAFMCVALLPAVSLTPPGLGASAPAFVTASWSTAAAAAAAPAAANVPWVTAVWFLGVAILIGRIIVGLLHVRRWSRSADEEDGVRYSADVVVPVMWGFRRPEILLPIAARDWSWETRDLVLRHERTHIAHHDWAWQMFARLVTAVLWFHPLAWMADRAMRAEAERVADDAVIAGGTSAPAYAAELVRVARATSAPVTAAVAMARPSGLEARVRRVLDSTVRRRPSSRGSIAAVASLIAIVTLGVAAAQDQQDEPLPRFEVDSKVNPEGVEKPVVLKEVPPTYPPEALKERIQGLVLLEAIVNTDGVPSDIKALKSPDPSLAHAAIEALLQWRFQPATVNGKPVRVIVQVDVRFSVK